MSYNAKMLREFMKLMHKRGALSDKELEAMLDALKINHDFNSVVSYMLFSEAEKEAMKDIERYTESEGE